MLTGSDGNLWHIWQTTPGKEWSTWASLNKPPNAGMDLIPVAARNADGRIEAFTVVPDTVGSGDGPSGGALWHIWQQTPGGSQYALHVSWSFATTGSDTSLLLLCFKVAQAGLSGAAGP